MLMRYPGLQRMTWHRAREHEEHEREDEAVVPVPEGGIIFPERVDPGRNRSSATRATMMSGTRPVPAGFPMEPSGSPAAFPCETTWSGSTG